MMDLHPRFQETLASVNRAFQAQDDLLELEWVLAAYGDVRLFAVTPERRQHWMTKTTEWHHYAVLVGDGNAEFSYGATLAGALNAAHVARGGNADEIAGAGVAAARRSVEPEAGGSSPLPLMGGE